MRNESREDLFAILPIELLVAEGWLDHELRQRRNRGPDVHVTALRDFRHREIPRDPAAGACVDTEAQELARTAAQRKTVIPQSCEMHAAEGFLLHSRACKDLGLARQHHAEAGLNNRALRLAIEFPEAAAPERGGDALDAACVRIDAVLRVNRRTVKIVLRLEAGVRAIGGCEAEVQCIPAPRLRIPAGPHEACEAGEGFAVECGS